MLTEAQREQFDTDGFVIIPGVVDAPTRAALRERAVAIAADFLADDDARRASVFDTVDQAHAQDEYFLTSGGVVRCFLEEDGDAVNKIGHAMHDLDPVFEPFCYSETLCEVVADLGFDKPQLLQSMYIFKGPRVGGEVVPHTDHTFLWTEPQTVTALWFAIDDATIENGCMWAVPGGHRVPARNRFRREGSGTVMEDVHDDPWPTDGWVPIEAPAGTMVLMHGQLPHRSEQNRSDQPRHAFTLHVIDGTADYPDDNWLQRGPHLPLRPMQPPATKPGSTPSTVTSTKAGSTPSTGTSTKTVSTTSTGTVRASDA